MLVEFTAAQVAVVRTALLRYAEELVKLDKKEGDLGFRSTELLHVTAATKGAMTALDGQRELDLPA